MDQICEVVITAPDPEWLARFTQILVEGRLAACGHNITQIRSIYRWQGVIHDESEARVALHTRISHVQGIIEQVNGAHPYEVPCVIAIPVIAGNPAYIQWVLDETEIP